MKFTLEENVPASWSAVPARAGHDVATVSRGGLARRGQEAVTARHHSRADPDLPESRRGGIRGYPPGRRSGIVTPTRG